MTETVTCNNCHRDFRISADLVHYHYAGDLHVQYMTCPYCSGKYHILTTNTDMRNLISSRRNVQGMIRLAMAKRWRKETILKYEKQLDDIKAQQYRLFPALKKRGLAILAELREEGDHGDV